MKSWHRHSIIPHFPFPPLFLLSSFSTRIKSAPGVDNHRNPCVDAVPKAVLSAHAAPHPRLWDTNSERWCIITSLYWSILIYIAFYKLNLFFKRWTECVRVYTYIYFIPRKYCIHSHMHAWVFGQPWVNKSFSHTPSGLFIIMSRSTSLRPESKQIQVESAESLCGLQKLEEKRGGISTLWMDDTYWSMTL